MPYSREHISKRLKRFREARNLTMREAAKRIGVPETTYREWEYGRAIRGEPYVNIARAFEVTLEDLLGDPGISNASYDTEFDNLIEEILKLKARIRNLKDPK
ncbi:hypothetical protein C0V70_04780 [Bacteriovorax stolpii]|uniref:Uncharacterized protein n=1 Tax=Bacteriovorax stolpii TaxID=960 RepID=A0A2K9NPK2_BACTC|nr:helix-turn-helix transcriptional regulator [Bacteriovorax stolpii]AUN97433.1 hypothetical protein C0V70_04780 [Bacteriovorax stolpii]TDP52610.1 helix-turn-helix protein [Bacteriovorax stolpii]